MSSVLLCVPHSSMVAAPQHKRVLSKKSHTLALLPERAQLQGRFSGRLAEKADEQRLVAECAALGPLLGESQPQTLSTLVRGIATGKVRKYLEDHLPAPGTETQVLPLCLDHPHLFLISIFISIVMTPSAWLLLLCPATTSRPPPVSLPTSPCTETPCLRCAVTHQHHHFSYQLYC